MRFPLYLCVQDYPPRLRCTTQAFGDIALVLVYTSGRCQACPGFRASHNR